MIEVHSPADGRLVGSAPDLGAAEVEVAAKGLRDAQAGWEELGPEGRGRHLRAWLDWFLDNERRLGVMVQAETGKAWADASLEALATVDIINYYARHAAKCLAPKRIRAHSPAQAAKRLSVVYRPYPLVGLITPWNAPIGNPILDCVGALMAGAAVLSKPSEVTPLSWTEVVRGWNEDTGAAVVDTVDMVMFTGSARTGRKIAARCGERLIPCSLELGGKDAMVVLADADLDRAAAAAAWGGMMNAGQACVSVERVYVEGPVYDEFVAKMTEQVAGIRVGTDGPGEFRCEVGAMITADQLAIVERHVRDAVEKGARVLTGGGSRDGRYFEPTVLVDVDHTATPPMTSPGRTVDVAVIGAGHNGLVAAAYLAQAGLEVAVLEASPFVGGMTRTERSIAGAPDHALHPCAVDSGGSHPGGGVSGLPGRNVALEILRKR